MNAQSYYPNYYSVQDIFVTQENVSCEVKTPMAKLGFLDPGSGTDDLEQGKRVNLPLWYIKELKSNNPYFTIEVPETYKNVHKAVCGAETTQIELGKIHPYFYEYGRYITPYDKNHFAGRVVFETCRQRVRHLLDVAKNTTEDAKPTDSFESIEKQLYEAGTRTNTLFTDWMQMRRTNIAPSNLVKEHSRKRKRIDLEDEETLPNSKR